MLSAGPLAVRVIFGTVFLLGLWLAANWVVQVVRKPTELFFPLSDTLSKTPRLTWRHYGPAFRAHATAVITPEFLAALAQVEGAGNPVARTYWRWQLTSQPFDLYRPASSAVGMYQITDGTFREAKRYCIHDHAVIEDGAWHNPRSCWFNGLYTRVLPSHAIELTAGLLDNRVTSILQRRHITTATLEQKQKLAAVIHLCGAGAGEAYAKRGFRLTPTTVRRPRRSRLPGADRRLQARVRSASDCRLTRSYAQALRSARTLIPAVAVLRDRDF